VIKGAVLTFVETIQLRAVQEQLRLETAGRERAENLVREACLYAERIIDTLPEAILLVDADLHVALANRSFYETFHTTRGETKGLLDTPRNGIALT
jgi:PAS domain-containing protein